MLTVALTGGIATGKSVVAEVLRNLGCYIHHSDKIAHELMKPLSPAWEKIKKHFGENVINPDKTINRSKLGAIIFSNNDERQFLNNLIHPLVIKKEKEIIEKLDRKKKYNIFISEAALTIEANYARFFDKVVVVYCKRDIQIKRLIDRDYITRTEAIKKIRSQMPSKEKLKYADYIIDTSDSIASTIEQTERLYRNLMMDYAIKYNDKLEK
ncbi:MAG: dephospho-CoA kinase [Candidatus Aminicenantes bacterium]|nr:dephospho-CoA kinase [Candidatus Aminicenantes bacterium]